MEAEYIGLSLAARHAAWINGFMEEIGYPLPNPLPIFCDNEAAIKVANGEEITFKRSKHMNVKYHAVRDRVSKNEISVTYVASTENIADQFTKALSKEKFDYLVDFLGFDWFSDLK